MLKIWLIAVLLLTGVFAENATAQEGTWVTHPLPDFGSGNKRLASGGKCAAFSFDHTTGFLFFDTNGSTWTELDLNSARTVVDLQAEGDLVLAVTDSLVIAYNARTGAAHTVGYEGAILVNSGSRHSWGCSSALAFLLTNQKMYVFDVALDAWSVLDHGLTNLIPDHGTQSVRDDYVAVEVITDFDLPHPMLVYSGHTHAFNQHTFGPGGLVPGDFYLDHGFAGVGSANSESRPWLLGYSADTNTFDFRSVDTQGQQLVRPVFDHGGKGPETCALAFYTSSPAQGLGQANMYGFDTTRGHWVPAIQEYQTGITGIGQVPNSGGRFAMLSTWTFSPFYTLGAKIFSGWIGEYLVFPVTMLPYEGTNYLFLQGGTVCGYGGMDGFQGFDIVQGSGQPQVITGDGYVDSGSYAGESFLAFSRYTDGLDRMETYIYNGVQNTWTAVSMPKSFTPSMAGGSNILVMTSGSPAAETLFYSPQTDSYDVVNMQDGSSVIPYHTATLGLVFNSTEGYFYDSGTGIAHHRSGQFSASSLGEHVCLMNQDNQNLAGYSVISGNWTPYAAGQDVTVIKATDFLGWAETTPSRDQVIVFNSLRDNWVPLDMSGPVWSVANGERTMIVADQNKVAAFDPENDATPTFLATFSLTTDGDRVVARWQTTAPANPTDFQLTGLSGTQTWSVAVLRDGDGFCGEDTPTAVGTDHLVVYELRLRHTGAEPSLLASDSIVVVPAMPKFQLRGAVPNPFNPMTRIQFSLDRLRKVDVVVFDTAGRRVATIATGELAAGPHEIIWRGTDEAGRQVGSGTYLVRLQSEGLSRSTKLLPVR